jgi:hypothetical protein
MRSNRSRSPRLRTAAGLLLAAALLSACGPAAAEDLAAGDPAPTTPSAPPAEPVDWKSLAYEAADCLSRQEWIDYGQAGVETWDAAAIDTVTGDVTGDGETGTAVEAYCPAPTSSTSSWVAVFDRTHGEPALLGVLADLWFRDPTVDIDEGTLTIEGPTQAGDDPQCCPGHWGKAVYEWDGARYVLTGQLEAPTSQPFDAEGLADGDYAGAVRDIDGGTLLIDVVEWYEGAAAEQACREDGHAEALAYPIAWCHDYYFRNVNDLIRALPLADDATVTLYDWDRGGNISTRPVSAVVDQIVSRPDIDRLFAFRVEDGVVVDFPEEHFVS